MPEDPIRTFTAFAGVKRLASGRLIDVALAVKARAAEQGDPILTFDDRSGSVIDLDLRGTEADITARFAELANAGDATSTVEGRTDPDGAPRSRGRPKLGVIAREVTLLPVSGSGLHPSQEVHRKRCGASLMKRGGQMVGRP